MDLALAAYVDPLARGRMVLFVGEPQSPAANRLGEVAHRIEVVPTGGRQRPSRTGRGTLRSHAESGEWDLVWISDAAAIAGDPAQLREVAEALSPRGVALLAVDSEVDYEGLYRDLRTQFEHVRMLGQAPFSGQSIVDFAGVERDPSLSFDGSIVGDATAPPARFIGLCGPRPVSLEAHAIVQLPVEENASAGEARRDLDAARARLEHSERRLEQAQREIARSGQKLDELRHELARVQTGLASAEGRERAEAERATTLAAQLESTEAALRSAEEALRAAATNEDAEGEIAELERSLHERAREVVALRVEVERRGTLVRDILEGRGEPPASKVATAAVTAPSVRPEAPAARAETAPSDELTALRVLAGELGEALVLAQRRAVDAEANKTEAGFARDEALAVAQRLRDERTSEVTQHARDAGRARGLLARVAELEEVRGLLEARAELLHADLREAHARLREAQRETELVREQYALAVAQSRAMEHARAEDARRSASGDVAAPSTSVADAVAEALSDAAARSEAALTRAESQIQAAEGARSRAEEEVTRLRTSLELLEAQAARERSDASSRITSLEATLGSERESLEARIEGITRAQASQIDALRGEITGLRLLVDDLEAARAARSEIPSASEQASVELASAREQLDRVTEAHRAQLELRQMTAARADAEAARALELAQRVLALDALVSRLQSALAHETERSNASRRGLRALESRLTEATDARDALEAVQSVRAEEERRTATDRETRLVQAERDLITAREIASLFKTALADTRALLSDAAARIPGSTAGEPRGAPTDAVLRERLDEMRVAIEDRDVLLRSLTAQLQDKDDRIRGLESTLRSPARGGDSPRGADADSLRAAVAEREERIARLRGELDEARASQARLETASGSTREREAELRRLQGAIADRDAQLMALEGRALSAEQSAKEMRESFASARTALEQLLRDTRVSGSTTGDLGDHVAELMRLLRRF